MSRAICEACSSAQPVDWKPGDLCTQCGQTVRREVRCFWCAKWTPAGKFCRRCGAAVLEESLYGAARMLRDAGTDRFTIPKLIVDLDPEQVDNFTRIYQRHAAAMQLHVEQVRFLESFLQQRHWSDALEEELTAELPWPDERFEKLSASSTPKTGIAAGPRTRAENLDAARAIESNSPFPTTRSLALLVRLLLDDWSVQRDCGYLLTSPDLAVRSEAALALTGWRVLYGPGFEDGYREFLQALRDSPFRVPAAVRLAMLQNKPDELPAEAMASEAWDLRFMSALASGDRDTLVTSLASQDGLERFAAARRLIDLDVFDPLAGVLRDASPDQQLQLFKSIAGRKKPASGLREPAYQIAQLTASVQVRRAAVNVLCMGCPPEEVERIAEAANGDSSSYQTILQRAGLPPDSLAHLGGWFLEHNAFRMDQFGMRDIAKKDRMPATFVPRQWDSADEKAQKELCGFAECQLEDYADEDLHRFLVKVAFGLGSVPVRTTVWKALTRLSAHLKPRGVLPIVIRTDSLDHYFGSVEAFLFAFTTFLADPSFRELAADSSLRDPLTLLLRYPDPDVLPALAIYSRTVSSLADAVAAIAQDHEHLDFILRIECIAFLGWLGRVPEFEKKMRTRIRAFLQTDLDHACNMALERLDANR